MNSRGHHIALNPPSKLKYLHSPLRLVDSNSRNSVKRSPLPPFGGSTTSLTRLFSERGRVNTPLAPGGTGRQPKKAKKGIPDAEIPTSRNLIKPHPPYIHPKQEHDKAPFFQSAPARHPKRLKGSRLRKAMPPEIDGATTIASGNVIADQTGDSQIWMKL